MNKDLRQSLASLFVHCEKESKTGQARQIQSIIQSLDQAEKGETLSHEDKIRDRIQEIRDQK